MRDPKIDQLAATLKSAGLVASVYDARNMAESITRGVDGSQKHMEQHVSRLSANHPLFQPVQKAAVEASSIAQSAPVVEAPAKPITAAPEAEQKILEQSAIEEPKEVFISESLDQIDQEKPISELMSTAETQESLSIFDEPEVKIMDEAPVAPVPVVAPVVESPVVEPVVQESAPVAKEPSPVVESPAETPKQVVQEPAQPQRELIRRNGIYELEIDKSKPKAELTQAEIESTDITKIFNFANR